MPLPCALDCGCGGWITASSRVRLARYGNDMTITMILKQCGVVGLLVLAAASVQAGTAVTSQYNVDLQFERGQMVSVQWLPAQFQRRGGDNGDQRGSIRRERNDDRSEQPRNRDGDNSAGRQRDEGVHSSRMTDEQRRDLRRQIDEAGHDIYRSKR